MAGNRGLAGLRLPPLESTDPSRCLFPNHPRSPAVTEGETTLHNPHPPLAGKTGKEGGNRNAGGGWGGRISNCRLPSLEGKETLTGTSFCHQDTSRQAPRISDPSVCACFWGRVRYFLLLFFVCFLSGRLSRYSQLL